MATSPLDFLYPGINPEEEQQVSPEVLQALGILPQSTSNDLVPGEPEGNPQLLSLTGVPTGQVSLTPSPGALSAPTINPNAPGVPPPTPLPSNALQSATDAVSGGLDAISGGEYFPTETPLEPPGEFDERPIDPYTGIYQDSKANPFQEQDPENLYNQGVETSKRALTGVEQDTAEANRLLKEGTALADTGEARSLFKETKQLAENHYAATEAERKDLQTRNVDPGRWWHNRSVPQKIMSVIGLFLGGLTMPRTGRNIAMEIINNEIDRDVQAQMAEQQKRQALFGEKAAAGERKIERARQYALDVLGAKQNKLDAVSREVNGLLQSSQISAQYRDRLANLQVDLGKALEDIGLRKKALFYEVFNNQQKLELAKRKALKSGTGKAKVKSSVPGLVGAKSRGYVDALEGTNLGLKERGDKWETFDTERAIPGINILDKNGNLVGDQFLASKKLSDTDEGLIRDSRVALESLVAMKEFLKLNPGLRSVAQLSNSPQGAVWNSLYHQAKIALAKEKNLGALAKEDLSIVEGIITGKKDPTQVFNDILGGGGEKALDSVISGTLHRWENLLRGYGFRPGEYSIAPPDIPERFKGALYGKKAEGSIISAEEARKNLAAAGDPASQRTAFDKFISRSFKPDDGVRLGKKDFETLEKVIKTEKGNPVVRNQALVSMFLGSTEGRAWYRDTFQKHGFTAAEAVEYAKNPKPFVPKKFDSDLVRRVEREQKFKLWKQARGF